MALGRLLLRLLLVPLGGSLAIMTTVIFMIAAHWNRFAAVAAEKAATSDDIVAALVIAGPWVALAIMMSAMAMLLPAALGVLLAEVFAIRSWIFHVINGGFSAWFGLTMGDVGRTHEFYSDPLIALGAGIAAGFVYWLVAGWSAGFWKPVFAEPRPADARPPSLQA
jgi:hypothetical protein